MTKRMLILVFAVLLVGAFAYAQTTSNPPATNTPTTNNNPTTGTNTTGSGMSHTKTMHHHHTSSAKEEGTIQSIDTANDTMTVQVGTETKTLHYTKSTVFMSGKKHVRSTTLKAGDKISFYADSKDNVRKMEVMPMTSTTAPTSPKKK